MSFSTLVSDIAFRDTDRHERGSQMSRAQSYASTAATSVSISGDISSQLHGGYSHPLARSWQAERQLTKVNALPSATTILSFAYHHTNIPIIKVNAHLPTFHIRPTRRRDPDPILTQPIPTRPKQTDPLP